MNLEVEETGPIERRLKIQVSTADVDAAFDAVYQQVGRSARIPGFRKGKVPRSVLEKYYSAQARDQVLQRLVQETLPDAVKQADLAVVGEPRLEPPEEPKQGAAFSYEAIFEIRPTIELKKVRGLEVTRPQLPEPEEDPVDAHLEQLRAAQGQLVEEPEGASASRGHFAVIDYRANVDGEPLGEGEGQEITIEIGGGRSLPGFEEALEGMVVDSERDFEVEMPEGSPHAGKSAAFHVKLVGLKRRELPELDDELAKDASEFESLAELRADLQKRVDESREAELKNRTQQAVIGAVIEGNPFPVPQSLVERQLASRIERAAMQLHRQIPQEELTQMILRWREEWRPMAERDVQLGLLVPDIAKAESIEVSAEDIEERLRRIAEEQGEKVSKLKKTYRERGVLEALEAGMLEEKVVEFLVSQATLSDA